jgi:DNA-binding IclR family transcriptional regulator
MKTAELSDTSERSGIQVIARAVMVLRSLQHEPEGLSLSDIAARVHLPRSTVQRIVAALANEQFLVPASERARVKIGPGLILLAASVDFETEKIAESFMRDLSRRTDETVDLSVLAGSGVVFVAQVQGTQRLAAVSAVGKHFPLHCTANGKALLSIMPGDQRERLLAGNLARFTAATLTDKKALEASMRAIQRTDLAFDLGEHSTGICAVGTAFRDLSGRAYSLSIPVPAARFDAQHVRLGKLLLGTKASLLAALGAP